ncbi:MAG: helix-turn-helix domain-containing protein [Clostridia bacterium]|nr:helix-turn-helix domain-containing protein [Clostridia bacterium]
MNQIKIGEFIASQRKKKNLTQAALADKLGITDRAVSKWERGKGLPDVSLMLDLCNVFGITVNELLCGEIMDMDNNKNEDLLLDMAKELEQKNKIIWTSMWTIMIVSITALFAGIMLAAFLMPEGVLQTVTMIGICIVFLIPCFYALKLEVSVGVYKCKNCGFEIVPTYSEALWAMHAGTTRYLKCPECQKRTWCKKVLKK